MPGTCARVQGELVVTDSAAVSVGLSTKEEPRVRRSLIVTIGCCRRLLVQDVAPLRRKPQHLLGSHEPVARRSGFAGRGGCLSSVWSHSSRTQAEVADRNDGGLRQPSEEPQAVRACATSSHATDIPNRGTYASPSNGNQVPLVSRDRSDGAGAPPGPANTPCMCAARAGPLLLILGIGYPQRVKERTNGSSQS